MVLVEADKNDDVYIYIYIYIEWNERERILLGPIINITHHTTHTITIIIYRSKK
jgi:hypothetical protein